VWPNTPERLAKELKQSDANVRRRAAAELDELPKAVAKPLVMQALGDTDVDVRLSAAAAALHFRFQSAGRRVVPWLNDPERRVRLAAAEVLRSMPDAGAVSALGRVLGDPDSSVREAAAAALGQSGQSEAAVALLGHLDDSVPEVRRAIVAALGELGDRRAVVPLIGKIQDPQASVRRGVARALGELGDARAGSALVLALRDNDESVRIAALEALGELSDQEATLAIISLLDDDPRTDVHAAALAALGRISSEQGLTALIAQLKSDDPREVASPVRTALSQVGARAVPPLIRCLSGQPPEALADGCALTLGQIGERRATSAIVGALRRGVVTPRAALRALGELGDPTSLPTVLEQLTNSDPYVRRAAIDAATKLLDPTHPNGLAVEPIERALSAARADDAERAALATLLGRTGSPRAEEKLVPLAEDADDPELRAAALEALGRIGPAGQDGVLLDALKADDAGIRLVAALALRRSGSGNKTAHVLLDRLERSAEQDRAALCIALAGTLGRSNDASDLQSAERLAESSRGGERDALIEAIGLVPGARASRWLIQHMASSADPADRAKAAEALASHHEAASELQRLARDVDPAVRENAVWALGGLGDARALPAVVAALSDRDVSVAGDAAAALGRLGARGVASRTRLCAVLDDERGYVRANALAGLRLEGQRCADGAAARRVLARDPSEVARRAAAALIANVPSTKPKLDRTALKTCSTEDPDGAVAVACTARPKMLPTAPEPVSVYVVPMGESAPVPRAPFALVLANGLMRLGQSDRRGEVFECDAPRGSVSLAVPAPLAAH
jgi:HEAT repeat protein